MDLNDADLAKTLECPVCLDVFDEPKLLICGHTLCQKCVDKIVAAQQTAAHARQGRDGSSIKCPECTKETEILPVLGNEGVFVKDNGWHWQIWKGTFSVLPAFAQKIEYFGVRQSNGLRVITFQAVFNVGRRLYLNH
ncbi:tripartite motif-containing protein 13-like protein [Aphelenchoides avenae]|nr:tripartite motif-containing protein 13-like protein [Aphelenchus avenae]